MYDVCIYSILFSITYIHTYIHTFSVHIYIHTNIHTYKHTHIPSELADHHRIGPRVLSHEPVHQLQDKSPPIPDHGQNLHLHTYIHTTYIHTYIHTYVTNTVGVDFFVFCVFRFLLRHRMPRPVPGYPPYIHT